MTQDNNPPGTSPIYAAARDMLTAIAQGVSGGATGWVGTLAAYLVDGGDYRALTLDDAQPLHADTLAAWAAVFGQPADGWRVDGATGGRVARLEWATDGDARPEGGRVMWIGGGIEPQTGG